MPDITTEINKINTAVYGEEVRGSISGALTKMATEAEDSVAIATKKANDAALSAANANNASETAVSSAAAAEEAKNETASLKNSIIESEGRVMEAKTAAEGFSTAAEEAKTAAEGFSTAAEEAKNAAEIFANKTGSAAAGGLIWAGSITFEKLPTNPTTGEMYSITDNFTTDERFLEGAGKKYPAGTNVAWTISEKWDCLAGDALYNQSIYADSLGLGSIGECTGTNSISIGGGNTFVHANRSVAIGNDVKNVRNPDGSGNDPMYAIGIGSTQRTYGSKAISIGTNITNQNYGNIAIGSDTSATGGGYSVAIGTNATCQKTNGVSIGHNALVKSPNSIAIGDASVLKVYTDDDDSEFFTANTDDISIGNGSISAGSHNIALGSGSRSGEILSSSVHAREAIAIGKDTRARSNMTIAIGSGAETGGTSNKPSPGGVALGYHAKTNASHAIAIGSETVANGSLSIAIGPNATTSDNESNTIRLGKNSLGSLKCNVSLSVTSDIRDKTDINPIRPGKACEFISKLQPFTYVANRRSDYAKEELTEEEEEVYRTYGHKPYDKEAHKRGEKKGERRRAGLSAQQIIETMTKVYGSPDVANIVNDDFHDLDPTTIPEEVENHYTVAYQNLIPYLIASQQEMMFRLEILEKENKQLKRRIEHLEI